MSTPTSLDLPDGVRRTTIHTGRGEFAALEALPVHGVCERREPALLVPGFTGSKEDFLAVLDLLAAGGRPVFAIDMRGQYETPGGADPDAYSTSALGSDIVAVVRKIGARHLLGHSYGGLICREALLTGLAGGGLGSLTLMSSGPSALTGPRATELRSMLAALGVTNGNIPDPLQLETGLKQLWQAHLEPDAVKAGVPDGIVAFLRERMFANDPNALIVMARHMLSARDKTAELTRLPHIPLLVIYGEDDNSWSPGIQEIMARRLAARRVCIPGAMHSPAVEAPATTAGILTQFWDATEAGKHGLEAARIGRWTSERRPGNPWPGGGRSKPGPARD